MKFTRLMSPAVAVVACLGMILPQAGAADGIAEPTQSIQHIDVALHDGGLLVGQVVDRQGKAQQGVQVGLLQQGRKLVQTQTDQMGRFAIKGLTGGAYEVATADTHIPVRAWQKSMAPPHAAPGALVVEGMTVRAQGTTGYINNGAYASNGGGLFGYGGFSGWGAGGGGIGAAIAANPLMAVGVVGALIAVPVAVADDDDDDEVAAAS